MATSGLSDTEIKHWRQQGVLIKPGLLNPDELRPCHLDFQTIYELAPPAEAGHPTAEGTDPETAKFHVDQLKAIRPLPALGAPDLNLLVLHPKILGAVRTLLGTPDIFLYMSYVWRKVGGQTNYSQPFHRDYPTHQLLVPPDDPAMGAVTMFIYLTDVSVENGALEYVTHSDSLDLPISQAQPDPETQRRLQAHARRAAGPAGTVLFYNPQTFHRGTDLRRKDAIRHVVGAGFRRTDMPWVAPKRGDFHPVLPSWRGIMERATPGQLAAIGVPLPSHPYWTKRTIEGVESRFPGWNSEPYRKEAGIGHRKPGEAPVAFAWPDTKDVGGADVEAVIAKARQRASDKLGGQ